MKTHYFTNETGEKTPIYPTHGKLLQAQYEQAAAAKLVRHITHVTKISHIK